MPETAEDTLRELHLRGAHARRAAVFGAEGGRELVLRYGDVADEVAALQSSPCLADLSWRSRLELVGRDRARLLNGLCTVDVAALETGGSAYGLVTDLKGRVISEMNVAVLEDRLWLELPPGRARPVREHLEHHRVIDDVDARSLEDVVLLGVAGSEGLRALGGLVDLPEGGAARVELLGTEVLLVRRSRWGLEGADLSISSGVAEPLAEELASRLGARWVGWQALEVVRVRAGVPRWGRDFGENSLPNETGLLEQAVDFEKGCYLGQEIVARVYYRGQPARQCCAVDIHRSGAPGEVELEVAAELEGGSLLLEGVVVGELTSVAPGSRGSVFAGIASIDRAGLDAQGPLALAAGRPGRDQTVNDEPQPQVPVALGFRNLNPVPVMPRL